MPFSAFNCLTGVLDGSIARAVLWVEQCCMELMDAARVMGDTALFAHMEAASGLVSKGTLSLWPVCV
jgi:antiviral helicase SKI2